MVPLACVQSPRPQWRPLTVSAATAQHVRPSGRDSAPVPTLASHEHNQRFAKAVAAGVAAVVPASHRESLSFSQPRERGGRVHVEVYVHAVASAGVRQALEAALPPFLDLADERWGLRWRARVAGHAAKQTWRFTVGPLPLDVCPVAMAAYYQAGGCPITAYRYSASRSHPGFANARELEFLTQPCSVAELPSGPLSLDVGRRDPVILHVQRFPAAQPAVGFSWKQVPLAPRSAAAAAAAASGGGDRQRSQPEPGEARGRGQRMPAAAAAAGAARAAREEPLSRPPQPEREAGPEELGRQEPRSPVEQQAAAGARPQDARPSEEAQERRGPQGCGRRTPAVAATARTAQGQEGPLPQPPKQPQPPQPPCPEPRPELDAALEVEREERERHAPRSPAAQQAAAGARDARPSEEEWEIQPHQRRAQQREAQRRSRRVAGLSPEGRDSPTRSWAEAAASGPLAAPDHAASSSPAPAPAKRLRSPARAGGSPGRARRQRTPSPPPDGVRSPSPGSAGGVAQP